MADVVIYTRDGCPYCTRAKGLLDRKGVAYTEFNASVEADKRQEMMTRSGRNTFPQVFVGTTHVGGCDDLHAAEADGSLDRLLAG
ncbi:glutaredoxin 3 [Oharaeibacter diazotrophicus]|uniref:Glutaredoxin n=1 Tax=Oharaeibacter diazotrophicus TaxID=1920512 RepID=A0A4R6R590_9HYPH|nr:glutaredoxin 3 [Oharaeibacter diazotrophicus]TDP80942.1 glutaredoxin 3 [Oharaeibacter diazotrophicus]BBE73836.1 glutaredoxin-3 [Pleomorphomonas sp. SM30]GLS74679.1 glutaredoxin 3 [Oharaeibacter diazotrophicus]